MLVAIYTGNIISFLTVIKTHPPFNSLRGLLDNTEYKFGILGGSGWEDDFKVSLTAPFITSTLRPSRQRGRSLGSV